jgi:serine/threonine protein kinase
MFLAATEGIIIPSDKYSQDFTDFLGKCLQIDQTKRATASELLKVFEGAIVSIVSIGSIADQSHQSHQSIASISSIAQSHQSHQSHQSYGINSINPING